MFFMCWVFFFLQLFLIQSYTLAKILKGLSSVSSCIPISMAIYCLDECSDDVQVKLTSLLKKQHYDLDLLVRAMDGEVINACFFLILLTLSQLLSIYKTL